MTDSTPMPLRFSSLVTARRLPPATLLLPGRRGLFLIEDDMTLRYLSLCSGIEAATQAWYPLGWSPVAFSEIDKFPTAVLAHHYPTVPNWGDMTKFKEWPYADVDVLVGGTPCQSFSVAGLRLGLDDPRGNLMLTYLAIAARYRPRWLVWENVPGVLSSNGGRDFGSFLGGLGELGYGFAYRVLDAQYVRTHGLPFAVPQRRRRVFVVGYLGDWRRAAAVLIEPEGLRGHPPPRREARKGTTHDVAGSLVSSGRGVERAGDTRGQDPVVGLISSTEGVSHCLNASGMGRIDYETETMVAHALRGEGFDASEDGTGRGTPIVPVAIQERAISENPSDGPDGVGVRQDGASYTIEARQVPQAVSYRIAGDGAVYHEGDATAPLTTATDPSAQILQTGWIVRRLTPRECERLQGFPDDFTAIPYRGKPAEACPDGPRYKALGNSMAVNVMEWIGERIAMVETA